jgi:cytochrome c553
MKKFILVTVLALAWSVGFGQVSVVPPTGIAPRFQKNDRELAKQTKPASRHWLLDANDDAERFRRVESWAGSIDAEMQIIAHRFEELHAAIRQGSWDLATYHWEKILGRMNVASMKRPTRTQNIEALFLEAGPSQSMNDALKARDPTRSSAAFQTVLQACIACHAAEKVGFVNDSPMFRRLAALPGPEK